MLAELSRHYWLITSIGFIAQALFAARMIVQWVSSERAHKLVSPTLFWVFSLVGSAVMFFYGVLRFDFSIILGQVLMYYIYIWNLKVKGLLGKNSRKRGAVRITLMAIPPLAIGMMVASGVDFATLMFNSDDIPLWLLLLGSVGQFLFAFRFYLQWFFSRKAGESVMPIPFWTMSLIAAGMVLVYGIIRMDLVLIVSQLGGALIYSRNIWIGKHSDEEMI